MQQSPGEGSPLAGSPKPDPASSLSSRIDSFSIKCTGLEEGGDLAVKRVLLSQLGEEEKSPASIILSSLGNAVQDDGVVTKVVGSAMFSSILRSLVS